MGQWLFGMPCRQRGFQCELWQLLWHEIWWLLVWIRACNGPPFSRRRFRRVAEGVVWSWSLEPGPLRPITPRLSGGSSRRQFAAS